MNFNAIKLNPSQELKLVNAATALLGSGGPLLPSPQKGLVRQTVEQGQPIFLRPLLCVLPDNFGKEEFLSIEKFEIFLPREKNPPQNQSLCFWAKLWTRPAEVPVIAPIPFALPYSMANDFSLEKVFAQAKILAECGAEPFYSPSSFKLCEAWVSKNEWKLYDLAWKKL